MDQKQLLLDIAMNLTRMGNWTADDFVGKRKRIGLFLTQTKEYMKLLNRGSFSPRLQQTITRLSTEFLDWEKELLATPKNTDALAETLLTWANILTHRLSLV